MVKAPVAGRVKTRLARDIGVIPATWWFRHQVTRLLRQIDDPRWRSVLAVAPDLVWVVLLQEVIKVLNQDQVIQRRLVLKADRCLFNVVFRSLVLRILTV